MRKDTRSLWEQYDSEIEPWRRGRMILVLIGLFSLVLQALNIVAQIALANVELLLPTISTFVVFWLLFYFSRVTAQGAGAAGPVQLQFDITNSNQDWQIETLSWQYLDYSHSSRRR